jgi:hypothetical protein
MAAVPRRSWLYRTGALVKAGANYRLQDGFPLRLFCLRLGLQARDVTMEKHLIECSALLFTNGRDMFANPKATGNIPQHQPAALTYRAAKLAATAFYQAIRDNLDRSAFIWEDGYWDKEDGATVWHEPGWQLRMDHPAADAFMQLLLEAHPDGGEYRAMLAENLQRQRSGEERRDDYYRELARNDYASTVAGN